LVTMYKKNDLLKLLNSKNIFYNSFNHEALFSVNDSVDKRGDIKGAHTKNLFLKNKKNSFFLVSCEEKSNIDLKKLSKLFGGGNLSFAKKEYMEELIGVSPGSVSPFALLNDKDKKIGFFLEEKLYKNNILNFHPLINTTTISINKSDFISLMIEKKIKTNIFSLESYSVLDIK